jgi:thiosulfate/3-mercaptopyruvate sulfurtransferase
MRKLVLFLMATILLGSCSQQSQQPPPEIGGGLVVHADNLAASLAATSISIIDVRPESDFLAGHIPGAVNTWRPQLADTTFSWSSITAPREQLELHFGALGLRPEDPVVFYDHSKLTDASNLAWVFQMYGKKETSILEGGFVAWEQLGLPIEKGPSLKPPTRYRFPTAPDRSSYAGLDAMHKATLDPGALIVDVRTWDEHIGKDVREGARKGGRIPNSVWFDYKELLVEKEGAYYLKPKGEMEALLEVHGITPDKKVYCYCQSGVRSANFTCILNRVLGYPSVKNFDGSWEEWSAHDELPFETGETSAAALLP